MSAVLVLEGAVGAIYDTGPESLIRRFVGPQRFAAPMRSTITPPRASTPGSEECEFTVYVKDGQQVVDCYHVVASARNYEAARQVIGQGECPVTRTADGRCLGCQLLPQVSQEQAFWSALRPTQRHSTCPGRRTKPVPAMRTLRGAPLRMLSAPVVTFEPNLRYETTMFFAAPTGCAGITPATLSNLVASLSFAGWKQVVVTSADAPGGCEVTGSGIWTGGPTPVDLGMQLPPGVEVRRVVRLSDGAVLFPVGTSKPFCPDPGNCPPGNAWNDVLCACQGSATTPQTCGGGRVQVGFDCVCPEGTVPEPGKDPKTAPCIKQSVGPALPPRVESSSSAVPWVIGTVIAVVAAVAIGAA